MKDKLITEIQASMASVLSTAQLDDLRRVLTYHLSKMEVTESRNTSRRETWRTAKYTTYSSPQRELRVARKSR